MYFLFEKNYLVMIIQDILFHPCIMMERISNDVSITKCQIYTLYI